MKYFRKKEDRSRPVKLMLLIALLIPIFSFSQKIHFVKHVNQADIKIYEVEFQNQADLKVYKVDFQNQVESCSGLWFETEFENQADWKLFEVKFQNQADLKIYYVKFRNQAGWVDVEKKLQLCQSGE